MGRFWTKKGFWMAVGLLAGGVAVASPWDIDMIDSRGVKAFRWKMMPPKVEGTIQREGGGAITHARPNGYYQTDYIAQYDRTTPEGAALTSPYGDTEAQLATGKHLFQVNCAPCHGIDGKGGGPVVQNDPAKGRKRFQMPAPLLSGDGNVSTLRTDGYIYLTIRNGGAGMPAYGVGLTDAERWAIVSYIRTLEGAAYQAPTPAPTGTP